MVAEFRKQLQQGHKQHCRWNNNPCPLSYSTFPVTTSEQLVVGFDQRLAGYGTARRPVLTSDSEAVVALNVDNDAVGNNQGTTRSTHPWAPVAVCGWEMRQQPANQGKSQRNALHCRMCNRTLGLWNFRSSSAEGNANNAEGATQLASQQERPHELSRRDSSLKSLDPVSEHRWFCPWVCSLTPVTSGTSNEQAGWEQVSAAILGSKTNVHEKKSLVPSESTGDDDNSSLNNHKADANSHATIVSKSEKALELLQSTFGV